MDLYQFISKKDLEYFCQKHHIIQLSFFGSFVRNDFGPHSDIDVLVSFEPGKTPGYDFFLIEDELTKILGRKVDLQTINFLSPEIRNSVVEELIPAYDQTQS